MSSSWVSQAASEVGDYLWSGATAVGDTVVGAVAGEFSQKRNTGAIIVDAVISMFPVAGEITAARDAIAIALRMCDDPKVRDDGWEWVALVLCLVAVVPVVGGLLKGIGKLLMRAVSKSEDLAKLCQEILALIRKAGFGNAAEWFRQLDFSKYQFVVRNAFGMLLDRIGKALNFILNRLGSVIPARVASYIRKLLPMLEELRKLGDTKIALAFKDLMRLLEHVRGHLVEGTWADVKIGGGTTRTMAEEARLAHLAEETKSLGHKPMTKEDYVHKDNWPDLREHKVGDAIGTFSVKTPIKAITRKPGEVMIRVVDSRRLDSPWTIAGKFWTDELAPNGFWWRIRSAIKHAWSMNGSYAKMNVPTREAMEKLGIKVPADWDGMRLWEGRIAEQWDDEGAEATMRLLVGGDLQYFVDFRHPSNAPVAEWIKTQVKAQRTNWTDVRLPDQAEARALFLAERERSDKIRQEGYARRAIADGGKQSTEEQNQ
ncbi:hypothetical protein ABEG10_04630 [Burkholderia cenocepacia]|uniref:hypothetical protein n=1 Tax=Burkholderia cenocepacia TaxID=95486 RepID=UPI001BA17A34|nr:hypothetical protein [Burkholderia cenocepacia]ELW9526718.1 hypothetical protein [Burkholderia cenocepacia]MBR8406238.1 hypothetical protein [Burkholderia cenocepacia]MCA8004082.1 hypothetical protein [Burkholderia cenocepacia]MCO8323100.1 hypothetical protein [Burkholderia cenocepacia]MCO8330278.1 hypothetical protein [Burkholderia cenocepacia]